MAWEFLLLGLLSEGVRGYYSGKGKSGGGKFIGGTMSPDEQAKFKADKAAAAGGDAEAKKRMEAAAAKAQEERVSAKPSGGKTPRTEESVLNEMKKIKEKMSKDMAEWSAFGSSDSRIGIAAKAQDKILKLKEKHGISEDRMVEAGILAKPKKSKKPSKAKAKEESKGKSTPKRPASFKEDKAAFEGARTSLSNAKNRGEAIRALDQIATRGMKLSQEDANKTRIGNADVTDFLLPAIAAESLSMSLQKGMSPSNARKAAEKAVSEAIAKQNKGTAKRRPSFGGSSSLSLQDNPSRYVDSLYNNFIRATGGKS